MPARRATIEAVPRKRLVDIGRTNVIPRAISFGREPRQRLIRIKVCRLTAYLNQRDAFAFAKDFQTT